MLGVLRSSGGEPISIGTSLGNRSDCLAFRRETPRGGLAVYLLTADPARVRGQEEWLPSRSATRTVFSVFGAELQLVLRSEAIAGHEVPRPRGGAFKSCYPRLHPHLPRSRRTVMAAPNVVPTIRLETPSPRPNAALVRNGRRRSHLIFRRSPYTTG